MKKKIDLPKDENGKPYWIPVVTKNKDYLVGFIDSYRLLASLTDDVPLSQMSKTISSDRFNDVLYDGTRIQELSNEDLKNKVKDMLLTPSRNDHPENSPDLYEQNVLGIDCVHCGMFYSFSVNKEIPEESLQCQCCGKTLILYTNMNDDDVLYDGGKDRIEEIVNDIHKELFNDGEEE